MKFFKSSAAALCLMSGTMATTASADSFNVTIVTGHPPVFRWVKMFPEAFIPTANEKLAALGHSVSFSEQYGGAIAGVGEELETVEAGLAELGVCSSLFDPAKMAVQNVTYYTPFVSDNVRLVTDTIDTLHKTDPRMQQAYTDNGVVYLGAPTAIDDYVLMTNFPVNSVADLDGRKIAAPGAAINWLSGTGAVGVSGNLTTYYNELQTGVYDGVVVFASAAFPGKLYEVAPYLTKAGLGAQFAGAVCANADWWSGLPEDVQSAFLEAADAAGAWYIDDLDNFMNIAYGAMEKAGTNITTASDDMRAAWASGMENAAKTWAEGLDADGKDASGVLTTYMDTMRAGGATPLRDWDKE
jgi:TRAP-type C4-dicarboxylate transport system substrate-binding protein